MRFLILVAIVSAERQKNHVGFADHKAQIQEQMWSVFYMAVSFQWVT